MMKLTAMESRIPERTLTPSVYDTRREYQNFITDLFKKSYTEADLEAHKSMIEKVDALKPVFDKSICQGLTVCELSVSEVGCGIIAAAQASTDGFSAVELDDFKKLVEIVESKGYYYPGRGLWWHFFDNFTSRICHWFDIISALKSGYVVTVLIKFPYYTRNHFTNLLGCEMDDDGNVVFETTDGILSLDELMKIIVTAPWRWNN